MTAFSHPGTMLSVYTLYVPWGLKTPTPSHSLDRWSMLPWPAHISHLLGTLHWHHLYFHVLEQYWVYTLSMCLWGWKPLPLVILLITGVSYLNQPISVTFYVPCTHTAHIFTSQNNTECVYSVCTFGGQKIHLPPFTWLPVPTTSTSSYTSILGTSHLPRLLFRIFQCCACTVVC